MVFSRQGGIDIESQQRILRLPSHGSKTNRSRGRPAEIRQCPRANPEIDSDGALSGEDGEGRDRQTAEAKEMTHLGGVDQTTACGTWHTATTIDDPKQFLVTAGDLCQTCVRIARKRLGRKLAMLGLSSNEPRTDMWYGLKIDGELVKVLLWHGHGLPTIFDFDIASSSTFFYEIVEVKVTELQ